MAARARLVLTLAIVAAAGPVSSLQQPQPGAIPGSPAPGAPTRTPPRASRPGEDPQKGTSVIRGAVVAGDTGNPLRRAMVNVYAADGLRAGGVTSTDAQGRFEVRELPAGRYYVTANKAGYVGWSFGQRRAEQPGTPLQLLDGQIAEKVILALPRGGVITGHVTDEFGDPIAGAQVGVMRPRFMNGTRRLMPAGPGAQTDDRGEFRIYGLGPGEYVVTAGSRSNGMFGDPNRSVSSNIEGYVQTFYPGTANAAEAQRVVVRAAQETTGVSFALVASRLVKVRGRIVSASGEISGRHFIQTLPAERGGLGRMMMMGGGGGMARPDGTFEISGVAPGAYDLIVRPDGRDRGGEFGLARVHVGSDDVDNVVIVMTRGATARGVIVTDTGEAPPGQPQQARIFARPADPESGGSFFGADSTVNADWSFELKGLAQRSIVSGGLEGAADWTLKAVLHGGQDVTDAGIDFVPGRDVENIQIVFTRQRTDLSGSVTTDRGEPDTNATVLIFPENRERWTSGSRYLRMTRPDQDGRYSVKGLPPADYFIVAVRSVEPGEWQDPDFLDAIADRSARVSLHEAESKVQNLRAVQ